MKTNFLLMISCGLLLMTSCSKKIEMCINGEMHPSEPGTYNYTWCGTNADHIEWRTNFSSVTLAGESVQIEFPYKGTVSFMVTASNNRKEEYESYTIEVGTYEARIEPITCNGGGNVMSSDPLRAYVYHTISDLQTDLHDGIKDLSVDSTDLEMDHYYLNQYNEYTAMVGAFKTLSNGQYIVYLQGIGGSQKNNLTELFYDPINSTLNVQNGEVDDKCYPSISDNGAGEEYFKNLMSKTFVLDEIWINSSQTTIQPCNADDNIIFNLDGTWIHDIGSDDCSGGQTNSYGTYAGYYACNDPSQVITGLNCSSGTWAAAQSIQLQSYGNNGIEITIYDGTNVIEQFYTGQ